jgi:SAM-dependent methyltransferase
MRETLAEIGKEFDTDKGHWGAYMDCYERHFARLRDKPVRLLELGVHRGGSLLMWQRYFRLGLIVGVDIAGAPFKEMPDRLRFYQGAQDDVAFLDGIARECASEGFDIIIDDASHIGKLARTSFKHLFERHLKPGGLYVIEDWGTGYWASWPDGAAYGVLRQAQGSAMSVRTWLARVLDRTPTLEKVHKYSTDFAVHNFGMVGFIKELLDEVAWEDITDTEHGNTALQRRESMIRAMSVYKGQVFVEKG